MPLIQLLGGVSIEGPNGALTGRAAQRHPVALLCLLGAAQPGSVSRDKLIAYLWPEKDTASARNLLNQAVHALRQAVGPVAIVSRGNDLALDPDVAPSDVRRFEEALAAQDPVRAVDLYRGAFLDGFFLGGSPEFERWTDGERERLRRSHLSALEELAERAASDGSQVEAAEWWRRLASEDPYNSRVTLRLMEALESVGDRAGAIRQAEEYVTRLEEDLEAKPNPEVMALAARMRSTPAEVALASRAAVGTPSSAYADAGASDAGHARHSTRKRAVLVGMVLIAVAITGALATTGLGGDGKEVATVPASTNGTPPTASREAYQFYLRGKELLTDPLAGPSAIRDAEWMFKQAVREDSTFALAWAALAEWHSSAVSGADALASAISRNPTLPSTGQLTADSALKMAVRYGPDLPETIKAQGWYAFNVERDREKALAHFEAARVVYPNDPDLVGVIGLIWIARGEWAEGVSNLESALQLDPRSHWRAALLGQMYAHLRRYDEADQLYDRALTAEPSYVEAYIGKAIVRLKRDGDVRGAREVLEEANRNVDRGQFVYRFTQVMARHPFVRILNDYFQAALADSSVADHLRRRCSLCYWQLGAELAERRGELDVARAYYDSAFSGVPARMKRRGARFLALTAAGLGRHQEASQWADVVVKSVTLPSEPVSGSHRLESVAEVQVRVRDLDGAIATLETLLSNPGLLSVSVLELDPLWDPLRGHPEFRRLLREYR